MCAQDAPSKSRAREGESKPAVADPAPLFLEQFGDIALSRVLPEGGRLMLSELVKNGDPPAGTKIEAKTADAGLLQNNSPMEPGLRAFGTRLAVFAATGTLFADNSSVRRQLLKAGPVGEQLVTRLDGLESKGWQFKSMGISDRYLQMEKPGILGRLGKMTTLSGYHYDFFKGERLKTLAYNNWSAAIGGVTGSGYGRSNPLKHIATIVGHEISHEDGTIYDFQKVSKLNKAEQQTLARRLLATETRAILTQLHLADRLGDSHATNDMMRTALRRGDLGGFIHDTWGKSSSTYASFGSLDRQEASRFVNSYIDDMSNANQHRFKGSLVDYRTGRVNAFDIDAGLGNRFGDIKGDAELLAKMNADTPGVRSGESKLVRFMTETKSGRILGRGVQAAGAVGVIATLADVKGAFEESASAGTARLGRVGLDYASFEVGTALGARLGRGLALMPKARLPLAAIPLVAMAGGFALSYLADSQLGDTLESKIKGLGGKL